MAIVVDRKPLSWKERTYFPAIMEGFKVTWGHFKKAAPFMG